MPTTRPAAPPPPARRACHWGLALAVVAAGGLAPAVAPHAQGFDEVVVQAREALRRRDRVALADAARTLAAAGHPLAPWAEYWELSSRLAEAQPPEVAAFAARWGGSYVEDRLRNDWLLELGRRRDWANFRAELPRFRMADDRDVDCYALVARRLDGDDVTAAARAALGASVRDLGDGCSLLVQTLRANGALTAADLWPLLHRAADTGRKDSARTLATLAGPQAERAFAAAWEQPAKFLARKRLAETVTLHELDTMALIRLAVADPDAAAAQLEAGGDAASLPPSLAATAWAHVARQAAFKLSPAAADHARRAWTLWDRQARGAPPPWSDEVLGGHVRAALREGDGGGAARQAARWRLVLRAVDAMEPLSAAEQREGAWPYWRARAQTALARDGADGDAARAAARRALESLASPLGFYGQLAAADLGTATALPPPPAAPSAAERAAARRHPGLARALHLVSLGLRSEGVREWNYSLRGQGDRELLATAQLACEQQVWDRCINTSERTRSEVDLGQRYPLPWRDAIVDRARAERLDPALVYGLVRQESRFIVDNRSHVGASGLMQLMPATARWTARRIGVELTPERLNEPGLNLQLGMAYLKLAIDDFGGSLPLATAAYNAGPNRSRRWREGPVLEPAAWTESIPFAETRDYVKKVLSNAVVYGALLAPPVAGAGTAGAAGAVSPGAALVARLGAPVGPRDAAAPAPDRDLP